MTALLQRIFISVSGYDAKGVRDISHDRPAGHWRT